MKYGDTYLDVREYFICLVFLLMTNKLIKKSIALIGGVMMLANVALPSFTYADEPSQPA